MSKLTESKIQKGILDYLNGLDETVAFKIPATGNKGISDISVCHRGLYIAIEVKRPTTRNNVSPMQQLHIHKIKKALGVAIVATSVEEVKNLIKGLK